MVTRILGIQFNRGKETRKGGRVIQCNTYTLAFVIVWLIPQKEAFNHVKWVEFLHYYTFNPVK